MDKNKRKTSGEEGAQPPPPLARSPYRPLSLRRRQALPAEPRSAVERPAANSRFTASPATVAAALARRGAGPDGAALAWGRDRDRDGDAATDGAQDPLGK
jgi:hypothetical protein